MKRGSAALIVWAGLLRGCCGEGLTIDEVRLADSYTLRDATLGDGVVLVDPEAVIVEYTRPDGRRFRVTYTVTDSTFH